jgi:colanic acid/amylovoran biosynthesis protein
MPRTEAVLVADPAFLLKPESLRVEEFWPQGDGVVGVNLSQVAASTAVGPRAVDVIEEYRTLVEVVLRDTGLGVLLVPHVFGPGLSSDTTFMTRTLAGLLPSDRIGVVPGLPSARQLKSVLAQCRFLVAARMHACIGALSSLTPTLSVAYSDKAIGVSRLVLGDDSCEFDLRRPAPSGALARAFVRMMKDEDRLRRRLAENVPVVCDLARQGAHHVKRLL